MGLTMKEKNQHLFWRAGFGPAVELLGDLNEYTPAQFYKALQKASDKKPEYIDLADDYLKGFFMGISELGRQQKKEISKAQKKEFRQKSKEAVRSLNLYWIRKMVNSSQQLREKMSFFWHGHFACRNLNVFYQQKLLDAIRVNALGNFGTLLKEVSKTAAMLNFLNNQQNRKGHPNENFAREVMELFTMGRGHYTEKDVKEAARAFTGWGSNLQGDYIFRRFQHDFDTKTFLGKTGKFNGDDILDILLEQPATAKFITQKIYKFFVNRQLDEDKINWLADRFYKNNYEIAPLLDDIFTSDWFYDEQNVGILIKSPVELLVGIQRMLPMTFENEEVFILLQRVLGQLLFYPPNVAGWPGGKLWIDSSTLLMRMRIPNLINDLDEMNVTPKEDDDTTMGMTDMQNTPGMRRQVINAAIDWSLYLKNFKKIPRENIIDELTKSLLQVSNTVNENLINQYTDQKEKEAFIKSATLQIMSTPEYQLC
ncbi:MAG: DUF1800 domain-containing protein [Chitinophagaceae bacterium]|nr:DUF1800 domain-containing protein [Chitinophagaceae bacterium]